jgi:lipooligosaccharide transport system ATP-binding protein
VCFGVLGPNGAGKTTTLRALLVLSPGTSGEIRVFGLPIPAEGRAVRARCGVVPQADNLDPDFTVIENLRVYARYFGLTGAPVEERIRELIRELSDRAGRPTPPGGTMLAPSRARSSTVPSSSSSTNRPPGSTRRCGA